MGIACAVCRHEWVGGLEGGLTAVVALLPEQLERGREV